MVPLPYVCQFFKTCCWMRQDFLKCHVLIDPLYDMTSRGMLCIC